MVIHKQTNQQSSTRYVRAGLLADVKQTLKKLSDVFFKFIDSFADYNVDVVKTEETNDGGQTVKCKHKETKTEFDVVASPPDKNGYVDVVIKFKDGRPDMNLGKLKETDVSSKKVMESIIDDIKHGNVGVKTSVKVTLQRVVGSNNLDDINMLSIDATCDIDTAMDIVNDVIDDAEFVALLDATPKSFELVPSDEDNTIEITDLVESNKLIDLLYCAIQVWHNFKAIHWNSKGLDFFTLHEKLDSYIFQINSDIDMLGELCVELNGSVPNPGCLPGYNSAKLVCIDDGFDKIEGFEYIHENISEYIDALEAAYPTFTDTDVQSLIDDMMRFWKTENNYKLTRLLSEE